MRWLEEHLDDMEYAEWKALYRIEYQEHEELTASRKTKGSPARQRRRRRGNHVKGNDDGGTDA